MNAPRTGHRYLDAVLDQPGSTLAFAHRGGAYHPELEGLENTLAAFRHADQLGYGYLETDVHATSDGALLAFHDAVLDRVTDLKGRIENLTLAEVGEALIGGRERVPTLARLFEEFPTARFNIDIKASAAVPLLARFLDENDAWDRVLVGSFSARRLNHFRRLTGGRVPTSAHPLEVIAFRFLPSGRLADVLTREWRPCRSPTAGDRSWWPPRGSYAGHTRSASTCTCGPSTTPTRFASCSTVVSTG